MGMLFYERFNIRAEKHINLIKSISPKMMKTYLLAFSASLLCCFGANSQEKSTLITLPTFPKAGDLMQIVYKPASNAKLSSNDTLICSTIFIYQPEYQKQKRETLKLIASNGLWKTEIKLSDSLLMLNCRIGTQTTLLDDNSGKGYPLYVYTKKNKPIQGALAFYASRIEASGKEDFRLIDSLFNQENLIYPKSQKDPYIMGLNYLALEQNPDTLKRKALFKDIKIALEKKGKQPEHTYAMAQSIFKIERNKPAADSIMAIAIKLYPKGSLAVAALMEQIPLAKDSATVARIYDEFVGKFSEKDPNFQSVLYRLINRFYAFHNNLIPRQYLNKFLDKTSKAELLNNNAWQKAIRGKLLDSALVYSGESLKLLEDIRQNPPEYLAQMEAEKRNRQLNESVSMYEDTYAHILYKQGKLEEAIYHQKKAYDIVEKPDNAIAEHYALFLENHGKIHEAKAIAEKQILAGKSNKSILKILKSIYTKEHSAETGFDTYLAGLNAQADAFQTKELAKEMLDEAAPGFTLKALDGTSVSLSDLKGKVVILDFWATWCGPCVRSFPAMAAAQEKFKDRTDVKFLFINTWENKPEQAFKFITVQKLPFTVLMDNLENGVNTTAANYKVTGIPAKFIIGKNGSIKFKRVGFGGSNEQVVDEISKMIDLASR